MGAAASHPSGGLASAINSFGDGLFNKLLAEAPPGATPATFLSPYGIAQALAMLLNGVSPGGESYQQLMAAVFGGGGNAELSLEALNAQLRQLNAALVKPPTADLTVADANSAWLAPRAALQPAYAAALQAGFGAKAAPIASAAEINGWVSEATRGCIKEIVDEGAVRQAILILINCVYFKGLWTHQFDKHGTHGADFHPLQHGAPPLRAATMFRVFKGKTAVRFAPALPAATPGGAAFECAAVQLPYRGDEFYAVAAMPKGELGEAPAEGGQRALLTADGPVPYTHALAGCRQALLKHLPSPGDAAAGGDSASGWRVEPGVDVKVWLPRFDVEYSANLNAALQALGIRRPFQGGDITQIAADEAGRPLADLVVSDVLHKVAAKVDEAGTEAAAAAGVLLLDVALRRPPPADEVELRFDRPFAFAVVHAPTGLALFCGEVHRPEEWQD